MVVKVVGSKLDGYFVCGVYMRTPFISHYGMATDGCGEVVEKTRWICYLWCMYGSVHISPHYMSAMVVEW